MIGYIYITKNLQNNKIYIGQSKRINSKNSYLGGGTIFKNALKKYGKEFFKKTILGYCLSQKELDSAEEECINFFNATNKIYGYNIRPGGNCVAMPDITKIKISKSEKGKIVSLETRKKIGKAHKGKTMSDDAKELIRLASTGRKHSEESKIKMSISKVGKKHTDYTKDKIRIKTIGNKNALGHSHPNKRKGTKLTDEQKKMISIKTKEALQTKKKMQ